MDRMLREAKLFDAKLGPIDGAGNVGAYLIGLVVARQVAVPAQTKTEKNEEKEVSTAVAEDAEKGKAEES